MVRGRRHALRRRHPGAARSASRPSDFARGAGKRTSADVLRRVRRAHRRRREARAAVPHRRRLRQRRRRHARAAHSIGALGCEVTELFCEVDGNFPEPPSRTRRSPRICSDLIKTLKKRRCGARPRFRRRRRPARRGHEGRRDHLRRPPAHAAREGRARRATPAREIIYDVKCTRLLAPWIERHGGKPLHLEDRPLAHQGEAEGDRRAARRRDVRATPSSRSAGTASTTRSTAARACWRSCRRNTMPIRR